MSLYFEERICEQIIDPENDQITFTYPWITTIPTNDAPDDLRLTSRFSTNYENGEAGWFGILCHDKISVHSITSYHNGNGSYRVWNGLCFITYTLYSSNELHSEFYTSPKTELIPTPNRDSFKTADGKMAKFSEAVRDKKVTKIAVFIELLLPSRLFYRPFEKSPLFLGQTHCFDIPEDPEYDFRFTFLTADNFTIRCPDGEMPCSSTSLFLSSKYMRNELMGKTKSDEFITEHLMDVVKPIVIFLHTLCFKMPETYDLDFVKRLLKAVKFFNPQEKYRITATVHQSLCKKFVQETQDFKSILQWVSIACQNELSELQNMLSSLIANKYYFKWQEIFQEAARNTGNELFCEIFGTEIDDFDIFEEIDVIYQAGFFTNVILN
uniref:BTB domain-containing protein n=1 Tax=Panagrolaimus davidi TaxID=227884 RepID=A0A914Q023_9BILA